MPRVLLICDRANWAYDSIARALIKYNQRRDLVLEIFYLKGQERELRRVCNRYDYCLVAGWQLVADLTDGKIQIRLPFFDWNRTLTGIHSHHSWDGRQSLPEKDVPPPAALVDFLGKFRGVNAVSSRLFRLFRDAGLSNLRCTLNGVDAELFRPLEPVRITWPLRVGFSGTKKHDWRKGITEFIEPACSLDGVELRLAMPQEGRYVPLDEMPRFYNTVDCYLCASSSEGFSLSVLEAAACGRPIVSTRVGGCEDLVVDGVNGFLVERRMEAIRERIEYWRDHREMLRAMGAQARELVERNWSWAIRTPDWLDFVAGTS